MREYSEGGDAAMSPSTEHPAGAVSMRARVSSSVYRAMPLGAVVDISSTMTRRLVVEVTVLGSRACRRDACEIASRLPADAERARAAPILGFVGDC
jgi:hypothetical protein